jgi:hypothetical protein
MLDDGVVSEVECAVWMETEWGTCEDEEEEERARHMEFEARPDEWMKDPWKRWPPKKAGEHAFDLTRWCKSAGAVRHQVPSLERKSEAQTQTWTHAGGGACVTVPDTSLAEATVVSSEEPTVAQTAFECGPRARTLGKNSSSGYTGSCLRGEDRRNGEAPARARVAALEAQAVDGKQISINIREALAVQAALETIVEPHKRVLLVVDNTAVAGALARGRSTNDVINDVICCVIAAAERRQAPLFVTWVRSADNVADAPSRQEELDAGALQQQQPPWSRVLQCYKTSPGEHQRRRRRVCPISQAQLGPETARELHF